MINLIKQTFRLSFVFDVFIAVTSFLDSLTFPDFLVDFLEFLQFLDSRNFFKENREIPKYLLRDGR